jgi:hypothetical protein
MDRSFCAGDLVETLPRCGFEQGLALLIGRAADSFYGSRGTSWLMLALLMSLRTR